MDCLPGAPAHGTTCLPGDGQWGCASARTCLLRLSVCFSLAAVVVMGRLLLEFSLD